MGLRDQDSSEPWGSGTASILPGPLEVRSTLGAAFAEFWALRVSGKWVLWSTLGEAFALCLKLRERVVWNYLVESIHDLGSFKDVVNLELFMPENFDIRRQTCFHGPARKTATLGCGCMPRSRVATDMREPAWSQIRIWEWPLTREDQHGVKLESQQKASWPAVVIYTCKMEVGR